MSLKYEPVWEPLHISVKLLGLNPQPKIKQVTVLKFSPDGKMLIVGVEEGRIHVLQVPHFAPKLTSVYQRRRLSTYE